MKQGWQYSRLEDVCDINYGTRVVKKDDHGSKYYVYGGGGATFMVDYFNREDCFIVSRFAMSPQCTRFVKGKFFLNDSGLSVSPKTTEVSQSFINKALLANNDIIYNMGKGMAQRNLDMPSFRSLIIPIPPLSEQEDIVSELDLLDGIIDNLHKQIKELDALAQAFFYEVFGSPIKNDMQWEQKRLVDITTLITNGNTPKGGSEVYVDEGILFFRSQNVWRNKIVYEDIAHIDAETNKKLKTSILQHNDILITKTGRINTENSSLGRAALFEGESGSANINGHVYLIRLNEGINHQFVLRILISEEYREYIRSVCVGGIDKRQINKEHVENFPIILPPIEMQNAFAEKIAILESQKESITRSIAETQKLFDYTMDKYFG